MLYPYLFIYLFNLGGGGVVVTDLSILVRTFGFYKVIKTWPDTHTHTHPEGEAGIKVRTSDQCCRPVLTRRVHVYN